MFAKLLAAVLLLFSLIVAGQCNVNIPERDNYVLVEHSDGTIQNISLLNSLDDDEYYNWNKPVDYTDEDKSLKNLTLYLYKRKSSEKPFVFTLETALTAPFDIKLPTVILVHGSLEKDKDWPLKTKDNYFMNGEYNVVIVDWTYHTKKEYSSEAKIARKVGQYFGDTLVLLIDKGGIRARDIHIVGFSLGAHVAGYMGKIVKIRSEEGERVGRITGLDPAAPSFEPPSVPPEKRLDKEDATFVDVIHTCSGVLGFNRSIGHVDFWPNSGFPPMPGCEAQTSRICSHAKAYEYYAESINSRDFVAQKCTSWIEWVGGSCHKNDKQLMGFYTNSSARGDYYLRTNADPPYAKGLCNENIPEYDNYMIISSSDGTVHNISLIHTLDDDKYFNWSQPVDYNEKDFSLNKTLNNVNPSLYIHAKSDQPYALTPFTALEAPFDIDLPTVVIVHGWLEKGDKFWLLRLKDKYFINGKYNVITVDWQYYALKPYWKAAKMTRKIGQYVGEILVLLIEGGKIRPKDIYIVGHSLGAHVAGYLGKTIIARTGEKVPRITALDPAGPLFETPILLPPEKRLTKDDAAFVNVIHTCSGVLGFRRSIGHVDFWPNSGFPWMPGCKLGSLFICSHSMSYEYFTESINTKDFVSHKCSSWLKYIFGLCNNNDVQPMGFHTSSSARGDYYLKTNSKKPYAKI